jgi:hypothetical protein
VIAVAVLVDWGSSGWWKEKGSSGAEEFERIWASMQVQHTVKGRSQRMRQVRAAGCWLGPETLKVIPELSGSHEAVTSPVHLNDYGSQRNQDKAFAIVTLSLG